MPWHLLSRVAVAGGEDKHDMEKILFNRITSGWDTQCYNLTPPPQNIW